MVGPRNVLVLGRVTGDLLGDILVILKWERDMKLIRCDRCAKEMPIEDFRDTINWRSCNFELCVNCGCAMDDFLKPLPRAG